MRAYLTRAFGEIMKFCVKIVWVFFILNASVLAQSKAQTISFAAAPAIAVGGTGNVSATASSGLTVSYVSTTNGVCKINGSSVTGIAAGICTVTASQAGNASYSAAPSVTQNFNIAKGQQIISFGPAPTLSLDQSGAVTVSLATGTVIASASSGLVVSLSSSTPSVCSINGNSVTAINIGTCTINANQAGNVNYNAAAQVAQSFSVTSVAAVKNSPEIVQITPASTTTISLAWLPTAMGIPASQVRYAVYVSTSKQFKPGPTNLNTTVVGKAQTTLSGLTAATTYYVLVIAKDNKGKSIAGKSRVSARTFKVPVIKNRAVALHTSAALGLGMATQNGNTLSFSKTTGAAKPPVNSLLLSNDRDGYQLQKVNKVSVSGSTINVTTSPAALSDALKQATVSNRMQLFDVSSAKSNASVANKVQAQALIAADGSRTSQMSWDNAYLTGQQTDHAYQAPQLVVKPNAAANQHQILMRQSASVSEEVSFKATVDFTPSLQSELSWSPTRGITSGKLIASGTLSVDLNAAYNFKAAASYNPTPVVLSTKTYTSLYFVGEVPVYQVVTLTITSKITASASAAINAVTDAKASQTVTVGVNYNPASGQWEPVLDSSSSQSLTAQLNINGGVKAQVRLIPEVKVTYYKVVSGTLSVEPYLDGTIQETQISSDPVLLAALAPNIMEPSQFDVNFGVQSNISVNMSALWRHIKLLSPTTIATKTYPLLSLPSLQLQSIDSSTLKIGQAQTLTLSIINGVNNNFNTDSIQWQVIPATAGSITSQKCKSYLIGYTCTASLTPQKASKFNVLASGYGILGEVARQYDIKSGTVGCSIGDKGPAGGIIFYCDNTGQHGLEAAPADVPGEKNSNGNGHIGFTWGCWGWNGNDEYLTWTTVGKTGEAIGTGAANTAAIIAVCGSGGGAGNGNRYGNGTVTNAAAAAKAYTLNGYSDWFLPSKEELNLLYQQKTGVGGFANTFYWSSTEGASDLAWTQGICGNKGATLSVRAVRAF